VFYISTGCGEKVQPFCFLRRETLPGIITRIKPCGSEGKKLSITIEGFPPITLPCSYAEGLREGQILSDAQIQELLEKAELSRALEASLRLLKFRPRSELEIRTRLSRKFPLSLVEKTIAVLKEKGLIDDQLFARYWVENRREFKPSGFKKLRYELRSKGIAPEIIREALKDVDFEAEAYKAAIKKAPRWRTLDEFTFKKKMADFLARQGFSFEIIEKIVPAVWREIQQEE